MTNEFAESLKRTAGQNAVRLFEPMALHTTFRCGGCADYFVSPENEDGLRQTLSLCREKNMPYFVIGCGSNLLVSDRGYPGVIIEIGRGLRNIETEERLVRAGAGARLSAFAAKCAEEGLTGAEFASGIPGTVGGAIYMNAGAYGGEMKQIVRSVRVLTKEGELVTRSSEEMAFAYRSSAVRTLGDIVLSAEFALERGESEAIFRTMADLNARRRDKQPLNFPSAGSTFKRPEGAFAGKLIQDAGLSGFSVGRARVSEKHCGFLINDGGTSAADVYRLIEEVRRIVQEKTGYLLECEVCFLGDFS